MMDLPTPIIRLLNHLKDSGITPLIVGGAVRNDFLNLPTSDYDIEVYGAITLDTLKHRLTPYGSSDRVGATFGVLTLTISKYRIDISLPRLEQNNGPGHTDFTVIINPKLSFKEASKRRDFTINSMGYSYIDKQLYDPWGGQTDIRHKCLRHTSTAFTEDPLRVLRAMQFAGRFGFDIAPETVRLCKTISLSSLPKERLFEEFKKLLLHSKKPSLGLKWAPSLGLLALFPGFSLLQSIMVDDTQTGWDITLNAVDYMATITTPDPKMKLVLMLAALCHLMDSEPIQSGPSKNVTPNQNSLNFIYQLTDDKTILKAIPPLIRHYMDVNRLYIQDQSSMLVPEHLYTLATKVHIQDVIYLARATHAARVPQKACHFPAGDWLTNKATQLGICHGPLKSLLTGKDLIKHGLSPGKTFSTILKLAYKAQLSHSITTKEEAILWLKAYLKNDRYSP